MKRDKTQHEAHGGDDLERAIDTHEVGKLLGLTPTVIAHSRARGEGPPFFRVGRTIRYVLRDVIAYRDARTVGRRAIAP